MTSPESHSKKAKQEASQYASILTPIPKSSYGYLWFISNSPAQPSSPHPLFVHPCTPQLLISPPKRHESNEFTHTPRTILFSSLILQHPGLPRCAPLRSYISVRRLVYIFPMARHNRRFVKKKKKKKNSGPSSRRGRLYSCVVERQKKLAEVSLLPYSRACR